MSLLFAEVDPAGKAEYHGFGRVPCERVSGGDRRGVAAREACNSIPQIVHRRVCTDDEARNANVHEAEHEGNAFDHFLSVAVICSIGEWHGKRFDCRRRGGFPCGS